MDIKTIKIKCEKPFGVVVAAGARRYAEYAVSGAKKVLIVSDETVFRLYGAAMKKIVKSTGAEAFTFIFPSGEKGNNKHVLDKLLILMTELNLSSSDYLIAFGGRAVASLTGFASAVFKSGVPFVFVPTTISAMIDAGVSGKCRVDFLGKREQLGIINYPLATFCDTEFLTTLPSASAIDGYAEIIRRASVTDGALIDRMLSEQVPIEEMIFSAIVASEKFRAEKFNGLTKIKDKKNFALVFATVAERITGVGVPYGKAVAFGIMAAADAGETLDVSRGEEEKFVKLFAKYGIKWDLGISIARLWQEVLSFYGTYKIPVILPKRSGKVTVRRLTSDKIKEIFCGR